MMKSNRSDAAEVENSEKTILKHNRNAFKHLTDLLQFEITQIRSEESQPGWTPWALLGGLATTLWLLVNELENHVADIHTVCFLLVVFSLALSSITSLHSLASPRATALRSAFRFQSSRSVFSQTRSSILIEIGLSLTLIWFAKLFGSVVRSPFLIAAYIYFASRVFAALGGFVLSFFSVPFTDFPTSRQRKTMPFVFIVFGIGVAALIGFAKPLFEGVVLPSIYEYKIAGLLLAIVQIIRTLAKGKQNTPLLQTLINIRRSLGLGELQLEDAKQQIEIALEGMSVSDVLQDEIAKLLSYLGEINIHLESATREIEAFTATTLKEDVGSSQNQVALKAAVTQSVGFHIKTSDEILIELSGKFKRLNRRAAMIIGMSPEAKETVLTLRSRILAALTAIEARKNHLVEALRVLNETSAEAR
jgi:hypothetical protein